MTAVKTNRERFLELLAAHDITQAKAAEIICEQTLRPCSVRAVRSWVNDPAKKSSRGCPDWAINALKKGLAE